MSGRKIIQIDREKCIGCGQCVNACVGGALGMVEGKAQLMREDYCDGLGVCIGKCPVDAISFVEKEQAEGKAKCACDGNEAAVHSPGPQHDSHMHAVAGGCPGKANHVFSRNDAAPVNVDSASVPGSGASALGAWPIQLHLVNPSAPQFQNADLLIAASCTAFACGNFHNGFLAGKALVIACPKLDNPEGYAEKLKELLSECKLKSVTVVRMEVPCCSGLTRMVEAARSAAGSTVPMQEITVSLRGEILGARLM